MAIHPGDILHGHLAGFVIGHERNLRASNYGHLHLPCRLALLATLEAIRAMRRLFRFHNSCFAVAPLKLSDDSRTLEPLINFWIDWGHAFTADEYFLMCCAQCLPCEPSIGELINAWATSGGTFG